MDAYPQVATPGGERYPEVEEAIDRRVRDGALLVNYIGHGGERGWAHERVLNTSTIGAPDNLDRMPLFFTATCELARFDDPELETAGEMMVMNPNGGAIAMMTTTRVVYSHANEQLNTAFFAVVFDSRLASVTPGTSAPHKESSVLRGIQQAEFHPARRRGPPAGHAANGGPDQRGQRGARRRLADTLSALEHVVVKGYISDAGGNVMTDFNGFVYPTVFDQRSEVTTLNNDGGSGGVSYGEWRNRIHTGASGPRGHL